MVTFDPAEGQGGIEGRAMAYTSEFLSRGIHVEVAALSPGSGGAEERYRGTRLFRLSASLVHFPQTFRSLVHIMSRSSIDSVFMLSGGSTGIGLVILAYARLTGRRSGAFFYGRDILQARNSPTGRVFLVLSVLLANGVSTNSRYTSGLLPFRPRSGPIVIYPGVDPRDVDSTAPLGRNSNSPRVLFVGRLVRRKGADLLLSAFSRLAADLPALRLDIVGDGPEMANLHAQVDRLGLRKVVTFHGALFGQRLREAYAEATIFVLPSRQAAGEVEGFGTVFLEAGVFGVPSIGTRTGGIPEAVIDGFTGKLVNDEDIEGLGDAMRSLVNDPPEVARLGRNAQARALRLTWGRSTDRVLELLGNPPQTVSG